MPVIKAGQVYTTKATTKNPFEYSEIEILEAKFNVDGEPWVKFKVIYPERHYVTADGNEATYTNSFDDVLNAGYELKKEV